MKRSLRFLSLLLIASVLIAPQARSDEGMWIPMLLKKYNISDMQAKGFKLTAEDVYSINKASLKDAVVIFGGGCTAELISSEGLLITNHHCGYRSIQRHSTVEHDYLTDGFWAMSRDEELPNSGLKVTFLVRMDDVTGRVLNGITEDMPESDRAKRIKENMNQIRSSAVAGTHYYARIAPFFSGNQYFMFTYEDYKDIRLVGAPPSAIGKFGGETDNWMWPRHTGDFSIFRVYANKNNQPADYSPDNVPYTPKKFLPISLKGVNKGDFTMVFGYPGRTSEYIPACRIQDQVNNTIPVMIDLRTKRLDVILAAMETSSKIRIQYSAKKSGIANSWKKNQGILKGLKRLDAVNKKIAFEKRFTAWVNGDQKRIIKYGAILDDYSDIISRQSPYAIANTYAMEAGLAPEIIKFAGRFKNLVRLLKSRADKETIQKVVDVLIRSAESYYKDYDAPTDQKILAVMYKAWAEAADPDYQPELLKVVNAKYKGDFNAYAADVFARSVFADQEKYRKFLSSVKPICINRILKDPAYMMSQSLAELVNNKIAPGLTAGKDMLPVLDRL